MPDAPRPTLTATPLWDHQKRAVSKVRDYVREFQAGNTTGASLIHMPTGTGKTGVIACSSHFLQAAGCVLLLSPRLALREQLVREVGGQFFSKLGLDADRLPKDVINVARGFPTIADDDYTTSIVTMTIQMLHSMMNRNAPNYDVLKSKVNLIIVDEGHYEPAISWRDAIRGIEAPKVIFTATPFRNDLKLFDIDFAHAYSYTFHEAIADNTIRSVEIHDRPSQTTPTGFVDDVIDFYEATFDADGENPPRVIIRCDSQDTICQIGNVLQARGKSHVLIHENFTDDPATQPRQRKSVPNPADEDAVYWVHQFKLLEGIDDPRFQLLACYEELKTTRSLVQQIGRVLRNPTRAAGSVAHVLDHAEGHQHELWEGFLQFDELVQREGVEVADFGKKMLDELARAQPDVVYLAGRFRTACTLDSIDANDELLLPRTANVYRKAGGFTLNSMCDDIDAEFAQQDRDYRLQTIDASTSVFLYLTFSNSPLLRSKAFIECKFGVTILREVGDYLCLFDSGGSVAVPMDKYGTPVSTAELRKLFSDATATRLTSVSLRNSNLGPRAIRARAVTAANIGDTIPTFDDHAFVCRTVQGYSENNGTSVRRYVGFQHGKVTDASEGRGSLEDYLSWLDDITTVLGSTGKTVGEFTRFAAHMTVPADTTPTSILLDVGEVQDAFVTNEGDGITAGEQLHIEDACCDVNNGNFQFTANGKACTGSVAFDASSKRYRIDSPDIQGLYTTDVPALKRGLVRYLNHDQSFRVIPNSEGCFYAMGEFYSPTLKFGADYDDDQFGLLRTLETSASLEAVASEKGAACKADESGWDDDSLFGIIDDLGVGHGLDHLFGTPELVVCDDMGTEAADFILADANDRRAVFIHAKGTSGAHKLYAASPLQEVCGQATKNLKYLARFGSDEPPNTRKWHNWKWTAPKVTGRVAERIRRKPGTVTTGLTAWRHIQSVVRDPYAELEVWLFLGRLFKKSVFKTQITSANPAAEAKQAAYLLFSTMNDVASVGGRLRVICSP